MTTAEQGEIRRPPVVDDEVVAAPSSSVDRGAATVVVVAYGIEALPLDWVPASVPVVVVHNDDLLATTAVDRVAVVHVFPSGNVGFGAGVNAALGRVTTPRVVLCNPDVRAERRHWTALQSDDPHELVVVGQMDARGSPTSVVNRYPTPAAVLLTAMRAGRIAPRGSRRRRLVRLLGRWGRAHADSLKESSRGVPGSDRYYPLAEYWPTAALVSMDTALLNSIGGFDERYFLYWEDVDLSRRLATATPDAVVKVAATPPAVHLVGGSAHAAATRRAVHRERWRSAVRYAADQRGASWRIVSVVLHVGSVFTARGTGAALTTPAEVPNQPGAAREPDDAGSRPVVAVVHATRRPSGETRRLAGWLDLLEAAGFDPVSVALLGSSAGDGRRGDRRGERGHGLWANGGARQYAWPGWRAVAEVASGAATPETLVWNHRRATTRLENLNPRAVVCVTLRAFSPAWTTRRWPVVVDLVDPLSESYRQRSRLARSTWRRSGFAALARASARAEGRSTGRVSTVAAGWTDARRLGVPWIPITIPAASTAGPVVATGTRGGGNPRWQVLFIGSLDYPPNIDAVEFLATSVWPRVRARLSGAVLGIAGRRPAPAVIAAARNPGVELIGAFEDLTDLAPWAQIAVSPLRHATGFQIKVLDAALAGLPQVVSSAALAGFEPGLAVRVADTDEEVAAALVDLLARPVEAAELAEQAGAQVRTAYGSARWAPTVRALLDELGHPGDDKTTRTLAVEDFRP